MVINVTDRTTDWHSIDWKKANKVVKNLRRRIFKATMEQDWKKVRNLQRLLMKSYSNILISVRRVCQINLGKKTPGIDKMIVLTPHERGLLVDSLVMTFPWEPLPAKRVYIPKSKGKKRPLGIPSIIDRALQAIVKNALEPSWEARFEAVSYGFRPGRSVHDAIERIYLAVKSGSNRGWILDADIKGCFDNIDHEKLLEIIGNFSARTIINQWLKAGYMEGEVFFDTEKGTPQGSIISPLLANIALHGMEEYIGTTYRSGRSSLGWVSRESPILVRYADDFVVLCHTKEDADQAKERVGKFLATRGLNYSEEKTRIAHLKEGIDFLGFNIRSYSVKDRWAGTKTLIKPSKESYKSFKRKLRETFSDNNGQSVGKLIKNVNPIVRGWCNFYRHAVSAKIFADLEHHLFIRQMRWCKRNHPQKLKPWIKRKYFGRHPAHPNFSYTFMDKKAGSYMLHPALVRIERFTMVKFRNSPDDPSLKDYWEKRNQKKSGNLKPSIEKIAKRQKHRCLICNETLYNDEPIIVHRKDGNSNNSQYSNLVLLHNVCHIKVLYSVETCLSRMRGNSHVRF